MFQCPYANQVWNLALLQDELNYNQIAGLRAGFLRTSKLKVLLLTGLSSTPLFPWLCWNLWKVRNQKMFNNMSFSAEEVLCKSIQDAKEWQDAQPGKTQVMPISVRPDLVSFPSGEVLCRSDAAWRQDLMLVGLG